MNIKAERIEQIIQQLNRSLQQVFSSQKCTEPVEYKKLQRTEDGIFGQDKFAYEMVYFVKNGRDNQFEGNVLSQSWEKYFLRGLETLLVECAIVKDDIERDCFVSRVYVWFTEKLVERRDLPRGTGIGNLDNLKANIRTIGDNNTHTLRGLDKFEWKTAKEVTLTSPRNEQGQDDLNFLPEIQIPSSSAKFGARNIPVYVKNGVPSIMETRRDYEAMLPKIPGAEDNFGMLYNKPSSDAEVAMHELWLARRKQEAFEWKAQQQMEMVMDRLDLQKSRLESDSLRRLETSAYLRRPGSAERRPQSARSADSPVGAVRRYAPGPPSSTHGRRSSPNGRSERGGSLSPNSVRRRVPADDHVITLQGNGSSTETNVARPGRSGTLKSGGPPKRELLPMRFRHEPPESFARNFNKQQYYMQLSDSDDDDKPDIPFKHTASTAKLHAQQGRKSQSGGKPGSSGGKSAGGGTAPPPGSIPFKREKPVVRERPVSARLFRTLAQDDPEMKVMYRYSNYRRMPLSEEQEDWLAARESERVKKSAEEVQRLVAAAAAKAEKKKDKGDGKDKKDKKDDKKKDKPKAPPPEEKKPVKPKYKDASEFMAKHFPDFDAMGDGADCHGPMRTMQLIEVARVADCFAEFGVAVDEKRLLKALVVPQDRPEAICLENLRQEAEGLMVNPVPQEYWRKVAMAKKGKKSGKGKKSKS